MTKKLFKNLKNLTIKCHISFNFRTKEKQKIRFSIELNKSSKTKQQKAYSPS